MNEHMDHEKLLIQDADVVLYRQFFNLDDSDEFLQRLMSDIEWTQESIRIVGKTVPIPRLTAWYGDEGTVYKWSGITQHPLAWMPLLKQIKQMVEEAAQTSFNSVLLNQYRSGQDSVSWHSDDEPELGKVIASLSLGAVRQFQFKRIDDPKQKLSIDLPHGSLLIMRGTTQQFWRHRIPKTAVPQTPRINLTFRTIQPRPKG